VWGISKLVGGVVHNPKRAAYGGSRVTAQNDDPRPWRVALNGAALTLAWLMATGAAANLESSWGWIVILAILAMFVWVHLVRRWPADLSSPRTSVFAWRGFVWFGLPISLLLVAGDALWLIGRNRLDLDASPMSAAAIIAFVVVFPLVEEFGFRLWIQTPLEKVLRPLGAVVLVALLFALFHSTDLPLPQFISGLGFGSALLVTRSIWVPVAMHVLQNALLISLGSHPAVQSWAITLSESGARWVVPMATVLWVAAIVVVAIWLTIGVRRVEPTGTDRSA
jgi:membrane protease YdiL (CAAX protease family)